MVENSSNGQITNIFGNILPYEYYCMYLVSFFCRFRVTVMAIVVVAAAALLPAVHSKPGKQLLSTRKHEKYYMYEYNRLLMHFAYIQLLP